MRYRSYVKWYGAEVMAKVRTLAGRRVKSATLFLRDAIQEKLSRPNPTGDNPSLPGEYPKEVTGAFKESVEADFNEKIGKGRVFSTDPRAKWFETGTRHMDPRPWLSNAFRDFGNQVEAVVEGRSSAGAARENVT